MKDFLLRNDTKLLFRNDSARDLQELTAGKKLLFVYGSGSVKKNGCYDDVKNAIEKSGGTLYEAEFIPEALFSASYRKSLTTLFPRFLKAMAAYHEKEIRAYFKDAFGYEGSVEESADKMVRLFEELGIDMYFDGDANEAKIRQVPVETVLKQEEVIRMVKACMR